MATSFDKSDKLPGASGKKAGKGSRGADPGAEKGPKGGGPDRSRRAIADDVRRKKSRGDKRKNYTIVGACIAVSLIIVGAAAYNPVHNWWQQRQYRGDTLSQIGAPVTSCQKVITKPSGAAQQHVTEGTYIPYTDAPPVFGQHYPIPTPMNRKLYTATDRPALGELVHNEEHGYTLVWYDATVSQDKTQMNELRAIADKLGSTTDLRQKFKVVPWLSTDVNGKKFPSGQHIAITHWAAHGIGAKVADTTAYGVWQYCSSVSGSALKTFMDTYDYTNSPEPAGA